MPSIKRRSGGGATRRIDASEDERSNGSDDDSTPNKRRRRAQSSSSRTTPATSPAPQLTRSSKGKGKRAIVEEDDDEGDDVDERSRDTSLDTSITVSPNNTSTSTFIPKQESQADLLSDAFARSKRPPRLADGEEATPSTSEDELGTAEDDDDDDDAEEAAHRQAERDRLDEARGGGTIAEHGVIERIDLINFMCHTRLTVPLGPQINFIIGHNGSGKSAVLTGLSVALGGKASSTNRASSIKSFVKEGSEAAQVTVWIKNKGEDAFKHQQYGDRIIIERRINADGGGHWKMKSGQGRTISTKREELDALCDHANIQVDNPLTILTQDAARQFLSASDPTQMYDFFLKGTLLHQLQEQYDMLGVELGRMKTAVAREADILPDLLQASREAARKYQAVEKQKDQMAKLDTLKNQLVWSQVVHLEKALEQVIARSEHLRAKVDKTEQDIERLRQEREKLNDTISELEERGRNDGEQVRPLHEERQKLKEVINKLKQKLFAAKEQEREMSVQYSRLDKMQKELDKRIADETAKLEEDNQEKHDRMEAKRRDIDHRRRALVGEEADVRDRQQRNEAELRQGNRVEMEAIEAQRALRDEVHNNESYVNRLNAASKNSIEAFGQGIPELQRAINREGGWHRKPVGPIGAYIKLKDTKWAPVLESVIGNTLNAFCVVDHHDRRLLESIKRRINCGNVSILTGSDERFDFSAGEPPEDVLTILRVLDVSDDYILRQLVNAVHIECSALVERRPDGDQLMRRNVRNVKHCFSADMFRIGGGTVGSSTQTLVPYRGPPRLSADLQGKLDEARAALHAAQQNLVKENEKLREASKQKAQLEQATRNNRQALHSIAKKKQAADSEMAQLDDERREAAPANIAAIEESRKETQDELEKCRERFQAVQAEKEGVESELSPQVARSEELKQQIEQHADGIGAVKHEISQAIEQRVQNVETLKARQASLAKHQAELEQLDADKEDKQASVESATEQALEYTDGERVEARRSTAYYEQQVSAAEEVLRHAHRESGGSLEQVTMEYTRCQKIYDDAKTSIETMNRVSDGLRQALTRRLDMWTKLVRQAASNARTEFSHNLSTRGYSGKLHFQHERDRLVITVQTEDDHNGPSATATQGSKRKDTRSLSGGEKSFTTVCLLLALWQVINSPLRCLDEFDVFMDAVNRKLAMSMMIDAAKKKAAVQYLLITPQSMTNTKFGPEVNVQKLNDPERGQGVLEFGAR